MPPADGGRDVDGAMRGEVPWGAAAAPDPGIAAAEHPQTRAWLRRWLAFGLVLTVLGAVLLPFTWSALGSASSRCADYLLPEYLTDGVVTDVSAGRGRSSIDVALTEPDRTVTIAVGAPSLYEVGEELLVVGSGDEWFVLPCSDNMSGSSLWLLAAALILLGSGVPILLRTLLLRRRLRAHPWREVVAEVGTSSRWWQQWRVWHMRIDGAVAQLRMGMPIVQDPVLAPGETQVPPVHERSVRLWVAGPIEGKRIPIAAPGGRPVLTLRAASSERRRESWSAVVDAEPR